jgi:PAS domain S-box-containing protein
MNKLFKKGLALAWLTLLITLIATFLIWQSVREESIENAEMRFRYLANEIKIAIRERMTTYEQVLRGGRSFFAASDSITQEEWKTYIHKIEIHESYPGIQGIGYSKYLKQEEIGEFERDFRRQTGRSDFRVWPEGERDFITSIIYIEPFDWRNQRAWGFDMYSEPTRREAMAKARDENLISVTRKLHLIQETDQNVQPGFLMYLPMYEKDKPIGSLAERRENFKGYIYAPFRMHDLMEGILGRSSGEIILSVYDGKNKDDKNLMFSSLDQDSSIYNPDPNFTIESIIKFDGTEWTLLAVSSDTFEFTIDSEKPLIVLFSGVLISILFFIVAWSLSNTRGLNRKLEQILSSTGEGIYGLDINGNCTFMNRAAEEMLGYKQEECIGKNMHMLIHSKLNDGSEYPEEKSPINNSIARKEGMTVDDEYFWRKDGTPIPVEYNSYPIIENKVVKGCVVSFTNISERKKYLSQIENSLHEKEVLLKEIHHRVKNNLQIISSILNLQASSLTDPGAKEVFQESRNRVRAMALIHEKLYQSENLSRVEVGEYFEELVNNLVRSYQTDGMEIKKVLDIDKIYFNPDTAISIGLIINELFSNSIKYAFKGNFGNSGKNPTLYLSLKEPEIDKYKLTVGDNGIGVPKDFKIEESETLGLQLVNSLVEQLDGKLSLLPKEGTCFRIDFHK